VSLDGDRARSRRPISAEPPVDRRGRRLVPIFVYHSVCTDPRPWIAPFTVTPQTFAEHLDAIVAAQANTMTVSEFVDAMTAGRPALPERLVLVTFDDGFADFGEQALPAMLARGIRSTLYVTTGFAQQRRHPYGEPMLDFASLRALPAPEVELGGHTHTHPQLDTLRPRQAREEVQRCKALLEDHLGTATRTFAYPHGYASPRVRQLVGEAGFHSACATGNALSPVPRDRYMLPRLMIRSTTTTDEVRTWVRGAGAPVAPPHDRARTRLWRAYRRGAVRLGIRPAVNM
jgi:peptidoglycan/xylan/chitin deacetylase (PgdA/CDA1 family)